MTDDLRIGIAGLGYWGPNLLRAFKSTPRCRVTAIADLDPARTQSMLRVHPELGIEETADELIERHDVDAIVLALPATVGSSAALAALRAEKHVLVEKPMAASLRDGELMLAEAERADVTAMVDYTFCYSAPVREMARLVAVDELGEPRYYQSTRVNLGRVRQDIDVVWDLVSHDLAILATVLDCDPISVQASGDREAAAQVTLTYDGGFMAFCHASWFAPTKVRSVLLSCERGMLAYDDTRAGEQLRIYRLDHEVGDDENSITPTASLGDVVIPWLPAEEPLRAVARAFVDSALGGETPRTDFAFGLRVLRVLDAARRSLRSGLAKEIA